MKKVLISSICAALLSTQAFSQDMLAQIQGKWKVDVEATKALPELKPLLKSPLVTAVLGSASQSLYEIKDSTITITFEGTKMPKVYKVIKNGEDELVLQAENEGPTYIYKHEKGFRVGDAEKGKEPVEVPPLVMVKAE